MLAHDRIIFAKAHLFRGVARIFLGDIEKTSVSRAEQFDLHSGWLRHGLILQTVGVNERGRRSAAPMLPRLCASGSEKSSGWRPKALF